MNIFRVKNAVMLSALSVIVHTSFTNDVSALETSRFTQVKIPSNKKIALSKVSKLKEKEVDILGINYAEGTLDTQMTPSQFNWALQNGFEVSFSKNSFMENTEKSSLEDYSSPEEVNIALNAFAKEYPNETKLTNVGKTTEGRDILALEISSGRNNKNKPTVLFTGMMHAREVMTTEVVLDIANFLLSNNSEEVQNWKDKLRIVLVPQLNPDGGAIVYSGNAFWRKNARKDNGTTVGVDLNRNFPATWNTCNGSSGSKISDSYRGPSAASEPETQSFMKFLKQIKPVMSITYHSYSELIIFPYGCRNQNNPSYDTFFKLAQSMNAELENDSGEKNKYEVGTAPEVIYEADGTDLDWQFKELGTLAYTLEINSSRQGFQPDFKTWRDVTVERQRGAWQQMLREGLKNSVSFSVNSQETSAITAQIFQRQGNNYIPWSSVHEGNALKVFAPNEKIFQTLGKGKYLLKIQNDLGQTVSKEFELDGKFSQNLGVLSF
jgi:carboxypeptidase T